MTPSQIRFASLVRREVNRFMTMFMRLPEIESGLAFISRLRAVAPAVRVVVMGGSDTPQLDDLTSAADCVCRKTFRAGDLLTAILSGAGARP